MRNDLIFCGGTIKNDLIFYGGAESTAATLASRTTSDS
jgi:hypothetical protein